jgi:glyoxylase-like metal-dependent hydrolase (beta-lactamase superfamily II)
MGTGDSALTGACMVCHVLLIETNAGLVLVDTALGLNDLQAPAHAGVRRVMRAMSARMDAQESIAVQVERLGFRREDVRHIVLTHLDLDHAGGIGDFPHARVHVYAKEHAAANVARGLIARSRYQPVQWAHDPHWELYETRGEPWLGFDCVRQLEGLPPEILLVPLAGHTRGHCAVAVDTGSKWLLHAGDAYFFHGEMDPAGRRCPPGLRFFQTLFETSRGDRLHNQERLRQLASSRREQLEVFCAHDVTEWKRLAETAAERPEPTIRAVG